MMINRTSYLKRLVPLVRGTDTVGVVVWAEGRAFVAPHVARAIADGFAHAEVPAWVEFPDLTGTWVRVPPASINALIGAEAGALATCVELADGEPLYV